MVNDALAREALDVEGSESLLSLGAQEAAGDAIAGGLFGGAFVAGRGAINLLQAPLASKNVGEANKALFNAMGNLEEQFGVRFPTTPGELTQSEKLLAYERFVAEQPGAAKLKGVLKERNNVERQVIQSILDDVSPGVALPPDRKIAEDLFEDIDLGRLIARDTRENAARSAEKHIMDSLDNLTPLERIENLDEVGSALREGVRVRKELFDGAMQEAYQKVEDLTVKFAQDFGDKVDFDQLIKLDSLIPSVNKFAKDALVPKFEKIVKTSPIDPSTGLRKTEEEIRKVMSVQPELLNSTASKWARVVRELKGGIPLRTAQKLRREISTDISFGEGLGTENSRFLHGLRDGITKAIEKSTGDLPSGELKDAFVAANQAYAEGIKRFQIPYVSRFLVTNTNSGKYIHDETVVRELATNSKAYREAKAFMEDNPEALETMRRGIIDDRISLASSGGTLDIKRLNNLFKAMPKKIRDEVLGPAGTELMRDMNTAVQLTKGGKLHSEDFVDILDAVKEGKTVPEMHNAISAALQTQKDLQRTYNSGIRNKLKNAESFEDVDFQDFTRLFLEKGSQKEIDQILESLGTGAHRQQLQLETLVHIFENAQGKLKVADIQKNIIGDASVDFSAESLAAELSGKQGEKYQKILGPEIMSNLTDLLAIKARGDLARVSAGGGNAGSLSAGTTFSKLSDVMMHPLRAFDGLTTSIRYRTIASMMARPTLRRWLERSYTLPEGRAILQGIFASSPLLSDVLEGVGSDMKKAKAVDELGRAFGLDFVELAGQATNFTDDTAPSTEGGDE